MSKRRHNPAFVSQVLSLAIAGALVGASGSASAAPEAVSPPAEPDATTPAAPAAPVADAPEASGDPAPTDATPEVTAQPDPTSETAPEPSPEPAPVAGEPVASAPPPEASPAVATKEPSESVAPTTHSEDAASASPTQTTAEPKDEPKTFGMPPRDPELAAGKTPVKYQKIQYVPGKGVEFESVDERHKIQMRLRAQMRYTFQHESEADPASTQAFQIRRARVQFKGNYFGKHNKYKFELAISPRDIGLDRGDGTLSKSPLLDWYFDFDYLKSFTIRVGQQKIPFSRQRVISSGNLQLVDRSIVNKEFTLDRDIGIDARSKDFMGWGWLRYYLGVYTGEGHSSFEQGDFGMNYLARVEVLPFGMFKDYNEADHARLVHPRLSIGATYAFLDEGKRTRGITGSVPDDGGTTDYHNLEVDFMFKWVGWSVFGEAFYRTGTRNPGSLRDDDGDPILDDAGDPITITLPRNGFGYMLQSGFMIPRTKLELAGRFAQVQGTGNATSLGRKDEIGGGPSYYFARHPFKLQADYFRVFDEGSVANGSHAVRVQLQGAF